MQHCVQHGVAVLHETFFEHFLDEAVVLFFSALDSAQPGYACSENGGMLNMHSDRSRGNPQRVNKEAVWSYVRGGRCVVGGGW